MSPSTQKHMDSRKCICKKFGVQFKSVQFVICKLVLSKALNKATPLWKGIHLVFQFS